MESFYFGMKVELREEQGVVIKPIVKSEWDKEPGIIRWDTNKEIDEEDWRGLFGTFVEAGGKELRSDHKFRHIGDNGKLK